MMKLVKKTIEYLKTRITTINYILAPEVLLIFVMTLGFLCNHSPLLFAMEAIAAILFAIAVIKTCRNNEGRKYLYCFHQCNSPEMCMDLPKIIHFT